MQKTGLPTLLPQKISEGGQFPAEGIYKVSIDYHVDSPNGIETYAETNEFEIIPSETDGN